MKSICLRLLLGVPVCASAPGWASQCVSRIGALGGEIELVAGRADLRARLAKVSSPGDVDSAVEAFAYSFARHSHRISDPWIAQRAFAATLDHADTVEDLENARRVLSQSRDAAEFYFTRMVLFSNALARANRSTSLAVPRVVASRRLAEFDRVARERGTLWHPQRREVVDVPLQEGVVAQLRSQGISICEQAGGLRFNQGLFFRTGDLYRWEEQAAQILSAHKPREQFLGLGDKGVRRFHRYYAWDHEAMSPHMPTADFLTIEEETPASYVFHVRELKYKEPTSRVAVWDAVAQLSSSAQQLNARYPHVPIRSIELILPRRGVRIGDGFSRSGEALREGESVYALLDSRAQSVQVDLPSGAVPIRVRLMEFPDR